jgi:hypothetical protein
MWVENLFRVETGDSELFLPICSQPRLHRELRDRGADCAVWVTVTAAAAAETRKLWLRATRPGPPGRCCSLPVRPAGGNTRIHSTLSRSMCRRCRPCLDSEHDSAVPQLRAEPGGRREKNVIRFEPLPVHVVSLPFCLICITKLAKDDHSILKLLNWSYWIYWMCHLFPKLTHIPSYFHAGKESLWTSNSHRLHMPSSSHTTRRNTTK